MKQYDMKEEQKKRKIPSDIYDRRKKDHHTWLTRREKKNINVCVCIYPHGYREKTLMTASEEDAGRDTYNSIHFHFLVFPYRNKLLKIIHNIFNNFHLRVIII
jgi:hypothetical protein